MPPTQGGYAGAVGLRLDRMPARRTTNTIAIVTATALAGGVGGLLARADNPEIALVFAVFGGILAALAIAPLGVWTGRDRPLKRVLPVLLLLPLGVCAWMGPRSVMLLTMTAAMCCYAMGAIALGFFIPKRVGTESALACPICSGAIEEGDTRCPHCAVSFTKR